MRTVVVDASALAAVVFGEGEADEVLARLDGARTVAPALLWFEMANTCLKKLGKARDRAEPILAAFHPVRSNTGRARGRGSRRHDSAGG